MATFLPNETVYCRFTGQAFTVVSCDGAVAVLRWAGDVAGETSTRIVGELTRELPIIDIAPVTEQHVEDLESRIEALRLCNPETGEQWADICAMEDVVVAFRAVAA